MALTILTLCMILVFILSLATKKLSVFTALTLVPLAFGLIAVFMTGGQLTDIFMWIKNGVFYSVNAESGKVSMGVISPAILILFAVLYFDIMLGVGLFDPLCEFFIKRAKGDPLKVALATVLVTMIVSINGDTTTTILIALAAFLGLYKQMNMKPIYLAVIVVTPIGIFNQLPWGGPTIAAATALDVDISALFTRLLPGMVLAACYAVFMAYFIGKKERKRLQFDPKAPKEISDEMMQSMLDAIRQNEPELKRPKLFWFNLLFTLSLVAMLILDVAHGGVLFMLGSAIALLVNYKTVKLSNERLNDLAADALAPALATLAAGVFSGVLMGSGMAASLAGSIASLIPQSIGAHMLPVYAAAAAPAICYLPQDAFYFGIAPVVCGVMAQFGITAEQTAVASMIGQSFRLISPVIPALYLLCDAVKEEFIDFQKEYIKHAWPILPIYLVTAIVLGFIPI
ncbi:citrate:proton symporter [Pygmaiobacter massiliensis]|uniref:citrate:proton symporter n=1 Tax=Pygmaiobacter massiliensis TaxID=1917873 RepID=UPI000C7D6748|nr:citrate:proton symporter [Pygmaiobacter massiliensis]